MLQTESFYVQTPIGRLQVFCSKNKVLEINLGIDKKKYLPPALISAASELSVFAKSVKNQLDAYFNNSRCCLNIDVSINGTDFQHSVWKLIRSIKAGETLSYSDVAAQLGSSPRAVGNACRANPVPIIVPCHRVVAKSGLGGFAGQRAGTNLNIKTWLLKHEQSA